jgi:hypothetical protein
MSSVTEIVKLAYELGSEGVRKIKIDSHFHRVRRKAVPVCPVVTHVICPRITCKTVQDIAPFCKIAHCKEQLLSRNGVPYEQFSRVPVENWLRLLLQNKAVEQAINTPPTPSDVISCLRLPLVLPKCAH